MGFRPRDMSVSFGNRHFTSIFAQSVVTEVSFSYSIWREGSLALLRCFIPAFLIGLLLSDKILTYFKSICVNIFMPSSLILFKARFISFRNFQSQHLKHSMLLWLKLALFICMLVNTLHLFESDYKNVDTIKVLCAYSSLLKSALTPQNLKLKLDSPWSY